MITTRINWCDFPGDISSVIARTNLTQIVLKSVKERMKKVSLVITCTQTTLPQAVS